MSDIKFEDRDISFEDRDIKWRDHAANVYTFTASAKGDSVSSDASVLLLTGKYAHGEENPTGGAAPVSWAGWSDGVGGSPSIVGDSDWGKLQLAAAEIAHSPVYDTGGTHEKKVSLQKNAFGSGDSTFDLYIRGQDSSFTQDAGSPSWEAYSIAVNKTWRYLQAKVVGQ